MSEFHVEVGAYALDALDEAERGAFEEHLAGCADCQRELAEFTETTARLGALGDVAPPAALRSSLLGAIGEVRPLPPLDAPALRSEQIPPTATPDPGLVGPIESDVARSAAGSHSEDGSPHPEAVTAGPGEPAPKRALEPTWDLEPDAPEPFAGHGPTGSNEPADQLAQRRSSRAGRQGRRARLLTLAVAAVTVIALAFGGWVYVLQRQQQVVASQSAAANQLLSAPDVQTYPVTVDGSPATFVVSKSLDKAMFVGANLPAAAQGRTYQLWTLDAAQTPKPDATFPGGPDTSVFMTGDIRDAAYLAVSTEPAGGSKAPTTTPTVAAL